MAARDRHGERAARSAARNHGRTARYLPRLLLLGLAVYVLLPQLTNLGDSAAVIERLRVSALALALGAQLLSYLGSGYLIRALVELAGDRLSVLRGTLFTLGAASVGLVAGGLVGSAVATYRWSRAGGLGPDAALLAGWLPTIFNSAMLLLLAVLGMARLLAVHELSELQLVGFAIMLAVLVAVAGGAVWALRHRASATALLVRTTRGWRRLIHRPVDVRTVAEQAEQLLDAVEELRGRGWHRPAVGAFANMAFDALTLYFLFVAAGYPLKLGVLLAGYGLPLLLGRLSFFLPGGVGVIEATMTALYRGLGVPTAVTVLVILAYRALSFWIPTFVGFPIAMYLDSAAGYRSGDARH
jgi:uncharacterized protein (TIRG00374 family)